MKYLTLKSFSSYNYHLVLKTLHSGPPIHIWGAVKVLQKVDRRISNNEKYYLFTCEILIDQ